MKTERQPTNEDAQKNYLANFAIHMENESNNQSRQIDWADKVKSDVISQTLSNIIKGPNSENGGTGDAASTSFYGSQKGGHGPTEFRIKKSANPSNRDSNSKRGSLNQSQNFSETNYVDKNLRNKSRASLRPSSQDRSK